MRCIMKKGGLENLTLMRECRTHGKCNRSYNFLGTDCRTGQDTNEKTFLRVAKGRGP